ncbi:MAG: hypothetical protein ACI814_005041 [Mariniblastus sp.]
MTGAGGISRIQDAKTRTLGAWPILWSLGKRQVARG